MKLPGLGNSIDDTHKNYILMILKHRISQNCPYLGPLILIALCVHTFLVDCPDETIDPLGKVTNRAVKSAP